MCKNISTNVIDYYWFLPLFQATIENTIKRAKNTDTAMVESVVEVRGPGNTFIIVETFAKNVKMALYGVQVLKSCLLLFRYCGPLALSSHFP
jgi:hypothetical protein